MKRIAILWFLGALAILTGITTPAGSSPGPWEPFTLEGFSCNGDSLYFTGMYMEESSGHSDGAGGEHLKFKAIYRGTAVNIDTGSGYVFSAIQPIEVVNILYQGGATEGSYKVVVKVISLDRNLPDFHVRIMSRYTYDANGNLRSFIDSFEEICK